MPVLALTLGLGFVTGLRCFTGIAAVAWGARLGWLQLAGTPLAFMDMTAVLVISSAICASEYITDQMDWTPSRVSPGPFIVRIATGGLCGACLCASANRALLVGALLAAVGAMVGAFTGYHVRGWLVQERNVRDVLVGIPESLLALGLACACVGLSRASG